MLPEERSAGHRSLHHLGASGGTRTPNPLIRSQMLYPLSYGRLARDHSVGAPAGTTPFGALALAALHQVTSGASRARRDP
jgi:hypothetical protein